jgi:hypothetical protein
VGGVAVPVVDVVGVVVVRDRYMPALRTVLMGVPLVHRVFLRHTVVDMVVVHTVDVPVVGEVGVIAVRDRDMAAAVTVDVLVADVGVVVNGSGHSELLTRAPDIPAACYILQH